MRPALIVMMISSFMAVSACSSVKLPDLDVFDKPEFAGETVASEFPKVADAPAAPEEIRSAGQWDVAARDIIRARDNFDAPAAVDPLQTPAEIENEFKALKDKVDAYKADDPQ